MTGGMRKHAGEEWSRVPTSGSSRGDNSSIVIDDEVLLIPRVVESVMLKGRALGAFEAHDPSSAVRPLQPVFHPDCERRRRERAGAVPRRRRPRKPPTAPEPVPIALADLATADERIYATVWDTLQGLQAVYDTWCREERES